jgi:hypothetical protein
VRVVVTPERAVAVAGEPVTFTVTVLNTTDIISEQRITLDGVDPAWVRGGSEDLALFPAEERSVVFVVTLPPGVPAGIRRLRVQVAERTPPQRLEVVEVQLEVPAVRDPPVEHEPM